MKLASSQIQPDISGTLSDQNVSPSKNNSALAMLREEEVLFMESFNDTIISYSSHKTIVDLFEEQVLKTPENIALIRHESTFTYSSLNESANKLARFLIDNGVKQGSNVGLLAGRNFEMIIGMFAILKAGGAYVPIDPEYPAERQKYILKQSSTSHVLTDVTYPELDSISELKVINLEKVDLENFDSSNLNTPIRSNELAYTIYTSGSTGVPKGVMIEHHSAVNLIEWVNNTYSICSSDRVLFITSMCFDLSVYDIFGLLSAGGAVVMASHEEIVDIGKLKEFLTKYSITFWDSVPTTMNYLVKELRSAKEPFTQDSLRLVFLSGDWIPIQLPLEIKNYFPNAKVISLGGATEATVWSNFYEVNRLNAEWKSIPYGKPIANNFFYVLDDQFSAVPIGTIGDLFIGGVGVARGYANDPEKTGHSFLQDPFNSKAGGRMYRTGDLGRMMPDGNLEFLGRKDSQVKIRGFRVELGEIENVLNKFCHVDQAVVIARNEKDGHKNLIAFIVPKNKSFNRKEILAYLKSQVPEYMIPAFLEELKEFPLTSNGKIDKQALSKLEISDHSSASYEAPQTEQQLKLAEIWKEILDVERVGIHDNFFELGGHSLMAVRMITRLEEQIGIHFPLSILFKYPTISSLLSSNEVKPSNMQNEWKSLVSIKDSGSKLPIYIIHGSGLNVLNFRSIAKYVDPDQPVYGLQAKGLSGVEDPLDDMKEIARLYIEEILEHNPSGPYALAGYSFGGYVAVEMRNQLEALGKKVKMLAIFDTNAVGSDQYRKWPHVLWKKIKSQGPKFLWIMESLYSRPATTIKYQSFLLSRAMNTALGKLGVKTVESNSFYTLVDKITEKHLYAFQNYDMIPFDDTVHLFRAKERIYFVNDFHYLGWRKYALKGVKVYEVPGDHKTMLLHPNAQEFARALQQALDNS